MIVDRMKRASKYLKEFEEIWDDLTDDEQRTVREKAIGMLKSLSLKRCDLERIPRSICKLSRCGCTAISPFTAYTRIRQLHSSMFKASSRQLTAQHKRIQIQHSQ